MSKARKSTASPGLEGRRLLLASFAISLGTALTVIDGGIATVALPTIAHDLHVDSSSAVLVVTVYQLVLVMTLLPFAALGEVIGLKRVYQWGQLVFTVATVLCFFANSLGFLLVVRVLQAAGASASLSMMAALLRRIYSPKHLGRGLGTNGVVASVSNVIAPTAGGLILSFATWPWVFALAAPFGILSLWLGWRALPDTPPRKEPYNLAGAVLNAAVFGLLIGGMEAIVHGDSPVVSMAIIAIGVALAVLLVLHERKETNPILPVDLLSRPVLALSVAGAFMYFCSSQMMLISLPFRMQHGYGLKPTEIGAMLAAWPLTTMITSPVAGSLSDRYPAGVLGGVGMAITTVGLILVAFLPSHPTFFDVAWRMSMIGAGQGMFLSPNARLIVGSAPRDRAASAGGLVATTRLSGQTLGATGVATLLALGFGNSSLAPLVGAVLTFGAGICSLARLRPSIRNPSQSEATVAQPDSRGGVGAA